MGEMAGNGKNKTALDPRRGPRLRGGCVTGGLGRKTAPWLILAMLCALSVAMPGPLIAQDDAPRRGVERFRMTAYPDRFPLAGGEAELTLDGRTRNLVVSLDLTGDWSSNPTLRIHHDESMIDGVKDGEDRIVAGPVVVDVAAGGGTAAVMLTAQRVGSYYRAYAVLEHDGDTWRTDTFTIEWKDEKPAADITGFFGQVGSGDFVALFVPLILAGGGLWLTRNAIVGGALFYAGFGVAYVFVDVNPLIAIVIGASALGMVALAITFKVAGR